MTAPAAPGNVCCRTSRCAARPGYF